MRQKRKTKGFGLVEAIIGAVIIATSVIGIFATFQIALSLSGESLYRSQGAFLAEEGVEIMKALRDISWSSKIAGLSPGTTYYLSFATSTGWSTALTPQVVDGLFYRSLVIENVLRNTITQDISTTGTLDSDTRKITVTVSWKRTNATSSQIISTYITNLFNN